MTMEMGNGKGQRLVLLERGNKSWRGLCLEKAQAWALKQGTTGVESCQSLEHGARQAKPNTLSGDGNF